MTLHAPAEPHTSARPAARGPLSREILELLADDATSGAGAPEAAAAALALADDVVRDDDVQLSLFLLSSLHYGSLPDLPVAREWDLGLLAARRLLEDAFEAQLRREVPVPAQPEPTVDAVARLLFSLTAPTPGPSLARYVAKTASVAQLQEFLMHRSIYTLREADPHSWAVPRLTGRAKAAMMEIQFDEYGSGDPDRAHAGIFAATMRGAGLDDTYGAYVDAVPAVTLASLNMMSMFGLNRRLRGAIVGHLAAFEMTSSIPNKHYGDGFRRAGFGEDVTAYFDEHVEADAVHEQIAGRDLAGALAEDEPDLLPDILFGAAACLTVDGWAGDHILHAWQQGRSALREEWHERRTATD
ncbi:iron-containing redox enzyme family protein [Microbacterium wangruii]|uniref:iron-containing redox enzyme family protein n=1 Tax=Microbacterium wangruii TaxID=3049073 RepID=UPI00256F0390|nr:iron-containing redox enzyme family protein [Microbacterium sp. zg-Y1211]MDL5487778.1 iron-containing redox enzyme family protein [Microbacterium sp. zg-Y1211]